MKYILFVISLLAHTLAWGQHQLQGLVSAKQSGEMLVGASVYLVELKRGSTTNAQGIYTFESIPAGKYTLQISFVSYKTHILPIDVRANSRHDVTLQPTAFSMEEVIVSGSSAKTVVKESPIPIAALTKTQWLQTGSTNLVDAISKMPGMSQITTGATLAKPVIRGLGFNRVITMHDGVRQEDNQWGEEHSLHIDEYSIDRYEIIRGAGSLMYGSDGIGGVMSVVTAMPNESHGLTGSVLYNYQTNQGLHGSSVNLAQHTNKWTWAARLSLKEAGNYQNPADGKVLGSNFHEWNYNGVLGTNRSWGYSRLYFSSFNQKINIIDGLRNSQGKFMQYNLDSNGQIVGQEADRTSLEKPSINPANSQFLQNYKISSNNMFFIGKASASAVLSYSQNHRREYGNVLKPYEPDLYFFLQNLYYDFRYYFPEKNTWEITIGSNGLYQQMNNRGNETLYPNFTLFDKGIFVFAKKKIKHWIVSGGLRYDHRNLDISPLYIDSNGKFQTQPSATTSERFAGLQNAYQNITGSVGTVWKVSEQWALKANIARGFRAPSVAELSSNGEHAGTYRYEKGNIKQQSEVSWQGDLGFSWENDAWYAEMSLFSNSIQQYSYTEKVQTAQKQDSLIAGVPVFQYVQGNAWLKGVEASVTYSPRFLPNWRIMQSFSLVEGRNLSARNDSARFLPFMPAPRWIVQLKWTKNQVGQFLRNPYAMLEVEHTFEQNKVLLAYNTETLTPAYSLVNVGFGASFITKNKRTFASLYIAANNLFDTIYQSHQSRLKYLDVNPATGRMGVFNMGRNISLKLLIPINTN